MFLIKVPYLDFQNTSPCPTLWLDCKSWHAWW